MHVIINHWQRALALWSDSCVLIGCPNRQDRSVLPAWNCPPWFRERKAFTKLELFGELSLRKHERLSWVYGATNKVGFPGSGSKNDILYSEQAKSFCKIQIRPFIDQACSVKMAGYKVRSFFCVFMDRDEVEVHKKRKKGTPISCHLASRLAHHFRPSPPLRLFLLSLLLPCYFNYALSPLHSLVMFVNFSFFFFHCCSAISNFFLNRFLRLVSRKHARTELKEDRIWFLPAKILTKCFFFSPVQLHSHTKCTTYIR